jgi:hypothetical protein
MNNEKSEDLRKRADMVRFNRNANERAPTAWFTSLKPKRQANIQRALERNAAELDRQARAAARLEIAALKRANRRTA